MSRWADFVVARRYAVLGAVVAALLALGGYGLGLGDRLSADGWDDPGSDSVRAGHIRTEAFGRDHSADVLLLFHAPDGRTVDDPLFAEAVVAHLNQLPRAHPAEIDRVNGAYWPTETGVAQPAMFGTDDRRHAFAALSLHGDDNTTLLRNYRAVRDDLAAPGLTMEVAGGQVVAGTLTDTMATDQRRMELIALPVVAVLLFLVFGGVIAAALPLLAGGLTVLGAWGIIRVITQVTEVNSFVAPVVSMIGLGLAIDYGLFVVSRFREELDDGREVADAVRRTVLTAGHTVVASATIVIAAAATILLFPHGFLRSFAYGTIVTITLAALTALTVLPALLAILGARVDALGWRRLASTARPPRVARAGEVDGVVPTGAKATAAADRGVAAAPWTAVRGANAVAGAARGTGAAPHHTGNAGAAGCAAERAGAADRDGQARKSDLGTGSLWWRLAGFVMRHPRAVALSVCAGLLVLVAPIGGLAFGSVSERYLPPDNGTRLAQQHFDELFPLRRADPIRLVFVSGDPLAVGAVWAVANDAPGLAGPFGVPARGTQRTEVFATEAALSDPTDARATVDYLRGLAVPPGTTMLVGGEPVIGQDSVDALVDRLPLMILAVLLVTTALLVWAFGSWVLPIKAALCNALGLGATLGILTWIFVDGHGAQLLNFTPQPIMALLLVVIVAVIYGLSTDYEVFLLSRIVEARAAGASTADAVREGTVRTGGIITAAALVLLVVTGAFAFSELLMMQYIAYGMVAALLIDATVLRLLLVPALMTWLDERCWWRPSWPKIARGDDDDRAGSVSNHGVNSLTKPL
ncbi:MMPL family transporter [Nocardia mangyaensis]|uniref:MMPL family transporter n=1 Tax=Nocardia mangyaensis TaxID=2213200 RepID=UPI0026751820|nr:MMPL family transporter [Nocardia mangyaensis]MDO3648758.1 MMPL family transporter [Nocardia mangyaensis]